MLEPKNVVLGAKVRVTVTKQPTNAAAAKTIVRLLSKDPAVKKDNARLRAIRRRDYKPDRRGGRLYGGRVVKQHPVRARAGESGVVVATDDVVRDLCSVARFIEVEPA